MYSGLNLRIVSVLQSTFKKKHLGNPFLILTWNVNSVFQLNLSGLLSISGIFVPFVEVKLRIKLLI